MWKRYSLDRVSELGLEWASRELQRLQDIINGEVNRWEDLRFPTQTINLHGAATDPDVEASTGLFLFDSAATETIFGIAQMPHAWEEGSIIRPHVHWTKTTSAAGNVLWQLEYEIADTGDVLPFTYASSISSSTPASADNNTAGENIITSLGDIDMDGYKGSSVLLWKLSRVGGDAADTYAADARILEFDIHYEVDSFGSELEFIKQADNYYA